MKRTYLCQTSEKPLGVVLNDNLLLSTLIIRSDMPRSSGQAAVYAFLSFSAFVAQVMEWKDFVPALNDKCLCLTPFCDESAVSTSRHPRACETTVHTHAFIESRDGYSKSLRSF